MTVKTAAFPGAALVQDSIRTLQAEGQKFLDRARKEVNGLIGKNQRRAIDQLLSQAKSIRNDLQKRSRKVVKTIEGRAEAVASRIETEAKKRLEALAHKLSLSSKRDVDQLAKRLSSLERKFDELLAMKPERA